LKNKNTFLPVFEVGIVNDEMPACRQISTAKIDPAIVAGMCASIIDFTISKLEDSKQIEFEREILNLFNFIVENRHAVTSSTKNFDVHE
jgi:hypothetical protein